MSGEIPDDEMERLQSVLYQALDEWLRVYVVNQLKNISAQPKDVQAADRALDGSRDTIRRWCRARTLVKALGQKTT